MALLNKIPGDDQIYIGGIFTLRRKEALREANITHVLSVLRRPLDEDLFAPYKHLVIEVDDLEGENMLEHFGTTNGFIQEGLDNGGGVLVHCAMGKSRSTTCVMAYMMHKYHLTPTEALSRIQQSRPICEPNEGFMKQLELYHEMQAPTHVDDEPAYQRWLWKRDVDLSIACGKAPDKVQFEDETTRGVKGVDLESKAGMYELKCRKCRRTLATSQYVTPHKPLSTNNDQLPISAPSNTLQSCAHYFLDPISWMRAELGQGKTHGRLNCPKCSTNVGKYAWQGMQCSCGQWVVPAICLARGRIDEVKSKIAQNTQVQGLQTPEVVRANTASGD